MHGTGIGCVGSGPVGAFGSVVVSGAFLLDEALCPARFLERRERFVKVFLCVCAGHDCSDSGFVLGDHRVDDWEDEDVLFEQFVG